VVPVLIFTPFFPSVLLLLLPFWPVAHNKGPCSHSIAPPPAGVGRRMERKRQKILVSRDKGSLTEQQIKQTVTTIMLIR